MLPRCKIPNVCEENTPPASSSTAMPSFVSSKSQEPKPDTMVCPKPTSDHLKTPYNIPRKLSNTFDFDLTTIPVESPTHEHSPTLDYGPMIQLAPLDASSSTGSATFKKTDLRIELPVQPTLVVQSPKTPTLSRKLKAVSLDSDSNPSNSPADCLELPRDVFSMPNTPKRQIPKTQLHKFGVRSHSGTNLGLENTSTSSNLSSFGSNQSITGSQTLKTLPEIMTLSDFSQGKSEPVRIKAKGLLERRGSNVSLTIDLCAAEAKNSNHRLNTARSVSNLNLTNIGNDKCRCKTDTKCECTPKRKDCKKCNGNLKRFQKLSTESCLCDENTNNTHCHGYKICQYSRLGCLNYLSYMRRKSLSNENLYLGPSYEFKKVHKKSEYPRNIASQFKHQILSEDFQLHLQNIQYLQTAGNVLSKKQLKECCKTEHLKDLHKEFWELPQNFQEKSFVSGSQSKNRYKTILPNEHSRVVLDLGQGQDSSGVEGYINANYIKGADYTETAYIATQGPLPHTTCDLWQMVVQSNTQKVVMLTPVEEKGRIKCELYFPEQQGDRLMCGKFEITCLNIYQEKSYCIRTLRIRDTTLPKPADVAGVPRAKFCCDKMKQCGIECKKLAKNHALSELVTKNLSDNVLTQLESNQNSPNHIISPEIQNNNCNNAQFFNEHFEGTVPSESEYDDDDIFTNIDFKANNKPRLPLRSRDCKFSDDFTDIMNSPLDLDTQNMEYQCSRLDHNGLVDSDDVLLDNDHVVLHYWYQTWPDHNLANTEEILALGLDILDLRYEMESLFSHNSRPSPVFNVNKLHKCKVDESTDSNKLFNKSQENHQRMNLASNTEKTTAKSEFKSCIDKLKEKHYARGQKCVETNSVPIVVHCSAGIGRTGCFLAILNGIQQLKQNVNVDVLAIVCALRLNRGGMVQTAEQYELIHKVLALYGEFVDK